MNEQQYKSIYKLFDSDLMNKFRSAAYDEDIGQHSWLTASELNSYFPFLALSESSHFLDFGCGPGGPLTYITSKTGAIATGIDLSSDALTVGRKRARAMSIENKVNFIEIDGNNHLPFSDKTFDVLVSFDVILHLQNRADVFSEWKRVLKPNGRLVFTDAGIVTGAVSNHDIKLRSINGYTQFVATEYNNKVLKDAGFNKITQEDQSIGVISNAKGRMNAAQKYKKELIELIGEQKYQEEQEYLKTVVRLYESKALSRIAYKVINE